MDIVDRTTRSRMMSGIGSRDTKPEIRVRGFLHQLGFRFRLNVRQLPGKPDLVFPQLKTVVFVHGCFWHRHQGCKLAAIPGTNEAFWGKKFSQNVARDKRNLDLLKEAGWQAFVIWECETDNLDHLLKLAQSISGQWHQGGKQ